MCDLKLDHEELSLMANEQILGVLQEMYPQKDLYSISIWWRESKDYILKAKGAGGDLIVGWK